MATIVAPPWEEQPTVGGIADAPTDGKTYGRKDAAWAEVVSGGGPAILDSERYSLERAYVAESDHLFLEWQYDKTPAAEQAWRDKVAEIKLRYPVARAAT